MARYFLKISYLGTAYHGWQIQQTAHSVQQEIETALSTILRAGRVIITGCGRTDTGVHASQYYAHFDADLNPELDLAFKLNSLLPHDIAIHEVIPVAIDAHARFDASNRQYTYRMHLGKDPFEHHHSVRLPKMLDIDAMNAVGKILCGKKDFTSFAKVHSDVKNHICTVTKAQWTIDQNKLTFVIEADRFLRNMVRAIVGTMSDVGKGKIDLCQFEEVFEAKDRRSAGSSAPAVGLSLSRVEYDYIENL